MNTGVLFKRIGKNRIFLFLILILILSGLCIYYTDNYMKYQNYPSTANILAHYPEGKTVAITGTVTQAFPGGFLMLDSYHGKITEFRVYSPVKVSPEDEVSVLGTLKPNYQIISQKMLVESKWSFDLVLIRSFLAFIVLFLIFNHYWKFDGKKWEFIRR